MQFFKTTALGFLLILTAQAQANDTYDFYINESGKRHGIDPAFIKSIMSAESSYNSRAVSHAGAQGLMQLMPATARRFGVKDVFNPEQNIEGSVKYLAWLKNRFNGDVSLVLAGYNAGEGNVDKYGGIPPFKETQNYVRKVLAHYGQGSQQIQPPAFTPYSVPTLVRFNPSALKPKQSEKTQGTLIMTTQKPQTTTAPVLTSDLESFGTPGVQVEYTPDQADSFGAFEETAINFTDAWESNAGGSAIVVGGKIVGASK